MKAPAPLQEELVASIAHALKPWNEGINYDEGIAWIREVIQELQRNPEVVGAREHGPTVGYRGDNKRHASEVLRLITKLNKRLSMRKTQFLWNLFWHVDREESELDLDLDRELGLDIEDQLYAKKAEMIELRERLQALAEDCRKIVQDPPGYHPCDNYQHNHVAIAAFNLMQCLSTKPATAGSCNSPYCTIASLLFEAVTGQQGRNLRRSCQDCLSPGQLIACEDCLSAGHCTGACQDRLSAGQEI